MIDFLIVRDVVRDILLNDIKKELNVKYLKIKSSYFILLDDSIVFQHIIKCGNNRFFKNTYKVLNFVLNKEDLENNVLLSVSTEKLPNQVENTYKVKLETK